MQAILDFISSFVTLVYNFGAWLIDLLFDGLAWVLGLVLKLAFKIVLAVITGLDLPSYMLDYSAVWGLLPSQAVWILGVCGIGQGLGIIGVAVTVRFMLNLIPASLTRV